MRRARPQAVIAEDEPVLLGQLRELLLAAWPELDIVAAATDGAQAIAALETHAPDVLFLDIHMPGINGVEAARAVARRAHVVFITAFDQYAVQALSLIHI